MCALLFVAKWRLMSQVDDAQLVVVMNGHVFVIPLATKKYEVSSEEGLMKNIWEETLTEWIIADNERLEMLEAASMLKLNDWCLAAGFVRNFVWDKIHGYSKPTLLKDIDLIYFESDNISEERDRHLEARLNKIMRCPWSVKNQARMHIRNGDAPYKSTPDAMTYWVEIETAVGACLSDKELSIVAPFGLEYLFNLTVTMNPKRSKPQAFKERVERKKWMVTWPRLEINHVRGE